MAYHGIVDMTEEVEFNGKKIRYGSASIIDNPTFPKVENVPSKKDIERAGYAERYAEIKHKQIQEYDKRKRLELLGTECSLNINNQYCFECKRITCHVNDNCVHEYSGAQK